MFEQKYNLSNAVHPGGGGEGGKGPRDTELDICACENNVISNYICHQKFGNLNYSIYMHF